MKTGTLGVDLRVDLSGVPTMMNGQFQDSPEAISVLMITAPRWSDGTPVQMVMHQGEPLTP